MTDANEKCDRCGKMRGAHWTGGALGDEVFCDEAGVMVFRFGDRLASERALADRLAEALDLIDCKNDECEYANHKAMHAALRAYREARGGDKETT